MALELGPEYEVPPFVPVSGGTYAVWQVSSNKRDIPVDQPEAVGIMRICAISQPGDRLASMDGELISSPITSASVDPQGKGIVVVTSNSTYRLESCDSATEDDSAQQGTLYERTLEKIRRLFRGGGK